MRLVNGLMLAGIATFTFAGCGGGGEGGSNQYLPAQTNQTYNLNAAYKSLTSNGRTENLNVTASNGCVGTASFTQGGATTPTLFEGKSALSATSMWNISYRNCTPAIQSFTTVSYYDSNYMPLGAQGDSYIVYTGPLNIPATVKVGDVTVIGEGVRYTNSTKAAKTGTAQLSGVVEADSQSSAFITIATKGYNSSMTLENTQLTKYRIDSSNTLSIVSMTIQYSSGVSLVMTKP